MTYLNHFDMIHIYVMCVHACVWLYSFICIIFTYIYFKTHIARLVKRAIYLCMGTWWIMLTYMSAQL